MGKKEKKRRKKKLNLVRYWQTRRIDKEGLSKSGNIQVLGLEIVLLIGSLANCPYDTVIHSVPYTQG